MADAWPCCLQARADLNVSIKSLSAGRRPDRRQRIRFGSRTVWIHRRQVGTRSPGTGGLDERTPLGGGSGPNCEA